MLRGAFNLFSRLVDYSPFLAFTFAVCLNFSIAFIIAPIWTDEDLPMLIRIIAISTIAIPARLGYIFYRAWVESKKKK